MDDGNHRIGAALAFSVLAHVLIFGRIVPTGLGLPPGSLVVPLTVELERAVRGDPPVPQAPEVVPTPDPPPESPEVMSTPDPRRQAQSPVEVPPLPPQHRADDAPATGESTRPATPAEVTVRVLLMSGKDPDSRHPDSLEARGKRYIYFNSPALKTAARPLADLDPRYPTEKLTRPDGAVVLQLLIGADGGLEGVDTVCSAPAFEKSARASIAADMRFAPAIGAEGPVRSYMLVEFGYGRGFPCARVREF